jgi:ribosome-associated protein
MYAAAPYSPGDYVIRKALASSSLPLEQSQRSLQLALAAARTAAENRGRDIVVLDLRDQTALFDYFVIATGASRRQLHAISEEIDHTLEDQLGDSRLSREGYEDSRWILLDYGSVVIHLFDEDTRDYYSLETLWGDANRVDLAGELPAESLRAPR